MKSIYSKISTILYVEDEKGVRDGYERAISRHAKDLYIAENGGIGLELYIKHKPDIVITDIKMPVMNGIEMCKAIKKINPEQEIIITTAHSETGYFMEAIQLQINSYLLKPVDKNLLTKNILSIAKNQKLNDDLIEKQALMEEIANLQNNLLVVYDDNNTLIFANKHFLNFFNVKDCNEFLSEFSCLKKSFIKLEDMFYHDASNNKHWTQDIETLEHDKRLVSINDRQQSTKTFVVNIKKVAINNHKICTFSEITHIATKKKELELKAYIDELTQIPNRAKFNECFMAEMERFQRYHQDLSLIMFDIDHFKKFNDTYGHQLGDDILFELAQLVCNRVRTTDMFARWGGEEFVILLANTASNSAISFGESMRESIETHLFKDKLRLSCSFGVATSIKDDSQESLLKRADDALYQAKEGGRNKVVYL
jgi:two-component system, cell cycle response regulator